MAGVRRSLIRDLIPQIERIAREHPCYSQVNDIIRVTIDHMAARARIEELHQEQLKGNDDGEF